MSEETKSEENRLKDNRKYRIDDLLYLMARLRDPETGCPWDLKQDYQSIAPFTLEEVYEVVDTIERGDYSHLCEELGDLLFQVVFYAQLGKEEGRFEFEDIVHGIVSKLISRHPHVFPLGTLSSHRPEHHELQEAVVRDTWENLKKQERTAKGHQRRLADVPVVLPALARAQKIQKRAAKSGFDWPDCTGVIAKLFEEVEELQAEVNNQDPQRVTDELGDLLFSCVNLARHLGVDAETAVRQATRKFEQRFSVMEDLAASSGQDFDILHCDEKEILWQKAKQKLGSG